MTASVKILTTSTLDSSPSIIITSPNGHKTLINCGEGCQRSFLESSTDRIRSVNQVCLTHIGYDATGGLPGMILTSADAAQAAASNGDDGSGSVDGATNRGKSVVGSLNIIGPDGLKGFIHSLRHFMRRDRFVLNLHEGQYESTPKPGDGMNSRHGKGKGKNSKNNQNANKKKKGKKRKKAGGDNENDDEKDITNSNGSSANDKKVEDAQHKSPEEEKDLGLFGITSIPMKRMVDTFYGKDEIHISSYLFVTTAIAGKFQVKKAKDEFKIPPGPLYSKLKAGESVTYTHPDTGEEVCVTPDQVLEGGSDGVSVALIYCPDEYVLDQFCQDDTNAGDNCQNKNENKSVSLEKLNRYKKSPSSEMKTKTTELTLELMIHYTPKKLFESDRYQQWLNIFGADVNHMTIYPTEEGMFRGGNEEIDGSPFRSAVLGAMQRSLIEKDIYPSPIPEVHLSTNMCAGTEETEMNIDAHDDGNSSTNKLKVHHARPELEYTLIPLSKKGAVNVEHKDGDECQTFGLSGEDHESILKKTHDCGALEAAAKVMGGDNGHPHGDIEQDTTSAGEQEQSSGNENGCLIFAGTGSAIPCKHRNVTGMYLGMNDNSGILLDVGEGTMGQLVRSWKSTYATKATGGIDQNEYLKSRIKDTKAAWISHPHADHHLGLVRFLTERNSILLKSEGHRKNDDNRIVLIASPNVLRFLDEYSKVDPSIYYSYIPVDCRDTLSDKQNPVASWLHRELGITRCVSVPVSHCYHSFAVVLDGTSFGRVVYSGDCRPSDRLVEEGRNADVLIHEATFENGMEEEAVLKMHSTVAEALSVGKRMNAKACILTHFSQRYPRIPPLREEDSQLPFPVAFAFDFMQVKPQNISRASKLTSALRMLFPEDTSEAEDGMTFEDEKEEGKRKAQEILSQPGFFATKMNCN